MDLKEYVKELFDDNCFSDVYIDSKIPKIYLQKNMFKNFNVDI